MQFVSNSRNKKINMMMSKIKSATMNMTMIMMMNMMLMHSERMQSVCGSDASS